MKIGLIFALLSLLNFYSPNYSPQTKEFYEKAFRLSSDFNRNQQGSITSFIVPHHLYASSLIASSFSVFKDKKDYKTIFILSPDHLNHGETLISTSFSDWQTPYGLLRVNRFKVLQLAMNDLVTIDNDVIEKEFGIGNLVAFIKKTFPNSQIVPIAIKQTRNKNYAKKAADILRRLLKKEDLLLISSDFSHNFDSKTAKIYDQETIKALYDGDSEKILESQTDSPLSLSIFIQFCKERKGRFNLLENSDSAKYSKDTQEPVVSYIIATCQN